MKRNRDGKGPKHAPNKVEEGKKKSEMEAALKKVEEEKTKLATLKLAEEKPWRDAFASLSLEEELFQKIMLALKKLGVSSVKNLKHVTMDDLCEEGIPKVHARVLMTLQATKDGSDKVDTEIKPPAISSQPIPQSSKVFHLISIFSLGWSII